MRTAITRVLLVGLAVVLLVYAVRHIADDAEALVALRDLTPESLEHAAFELTDEVQLAIDAGGSFESGEADTVWAAYGWIVDRQTGERVWWMSGARPRRGSFRAVSDTIQLPPGTYDAYFSSHGNPTARSTERPDATLIERLRRMLSREGRGWYGDANRWRFVVWLLEEEDPDVARSLGEGQEEALWRSSRTVWASGPLRNNERAEELLFVSEPSTVVIRATGEITTAGQSGDAREDAGVVADSARLLRVSDGSFVWQFDDDNTSWAGGAPWNKRARDTLRLEPGVYQAVAVADEKHAYGDWRGHPPVQPYAWGMRIDQATASTAARVIDPFSGRLDLPRIVSLDCIGPDSVAEARFSIEETMPVLVVAVGELTDSGQYDFAFIDETPSGGSLRRVWTMKRENTDHAGGASKNRRAKEVLRLDSGVYRLTYETDGSHDCSDYNARPPGNPGFWGARIYALDPARDAWERLESPALVDSSR